MNCDLMRYFFGGKTSSVLFDVSQDSLTFHCHRPVCVRCRVFPIIPVSGPFLSDVPGFHLLVTVSFHCSLGLLASKALPLYIFILTTAVMFSSSFNVPEPFQSYHSRDHHYRFHPCFLQNLISPIFRYCTRPQDLIC